MDIKQYGNVKIAQMPVRFDAQTSIEAEKGIVRNSFFSPDYS